MRMPMSVAVTLLPIDQLSSGVCAVMVSPYRSPMSLPLHVTTKADVMPSAGSKAASTACLTFAVSSSAGGASPAGAAPPRPGRVAGAGGRRLNRPGGESPQALAGWERHASLVTQILGRARDAVGERHTHRLRAPIDHGPSHLRALSVGAREVPDVLGGELGIEPGDEDRRTHDLGVARRVVLKRVAGGWHVRGVELEGFCSRDELLAGGDGPLCGGAFPSRRLRLGVPDGRRPGDQQKRGPDGVNPHSNLPRAVATPRKWGLFESRPRGARNDVRPPEPWERPRRTCLLSRVGILPKWRGSSRSPKAPRSG